MSSFFYRDFEEQFYAPREIIKNLRTQYLPFIMPLNSIYKNGKTFDIGCGRGEWLEIMQEIGLKPYGMDLDEGMLRACYENGLPASQGDAIEYLRSLPDESQIIVSSFHVIEHITFDRLQLLIRESLRVLQPCGLLILETPNPENIVVSTSNFYLDPTHIRPIPDKLLSFLTDHAGFYRSKTLRMQESKELLNSHHIKLFNVMSGASPDYAIIAQKNGHKKHLESFDAPFDSEYGLSLEVLSSRYDESIQHQLSEMEIKNQQAIESIKEFNGNLQRQLVGIEIKTQQALEVALELKDRGDAAYQQLNEIINSHSWRITRPLRLLKKQLLHQLLLLKRIIRWLTLRAIYFTLRSRIIRKPTSRLLNISPRLKDRLRNLAVTKGLLPSVTKQDHVFLSNCNTTYLQNNPELASLPRRARIIHIKIQKALKYGCEE